MSGPKVVRVVTREELIAICEGNIAALKAALEQWRKVGLRNELISDEDVRLAERRITAMREMLSADRFAEIQKQVPLEIAFLKTDMTRRIERAVEEKAQARNEDRRRIRAAEALVRALTAKGIAVPSPLRDPGAQSGEQLQAAIAAAFNLLAPSATGDGPTDRQRELAAKLAEDESRLTLAQWLSAQPDTRQEATDTLEVERRLDELKSINPPRAEAFVARLGHILTDTSPRRSLLIDSFAADIAQSRWEAIAEANAWEELDAVLEQLASISKSSPEGLLSDVEALRGSSPTVSDILKLVSRAKDDVAKHVKIQAEIAKRSALLEGLSELGYVVKEGMQTAWVENGRVVLKSSKSPNYGVEVGGDPNNNMQLRTVRFGDADAASDVVADVAAETEFCGDFSKLQGKIAEAGGELTIVKALGIGATPVKRVAADSQLAEVQRTSVNLPAASRKL